MNLFKRTKSIVTKGSKQSDAPTSSSSSRQPLGPQTNIDLQTSHSSIPDHPSPQSHGHSEKLSPKRVVGAKISHRDVLDDNRQKPSHSSSPQKQDNRTLHSLPPPPRSPPLPAKSPYSDMYTQNDLQTFSFGAALPNPSTSSLYPSIDPLTRLLDDADSDEISIIPDTTPRPSVVGNQQPRSPQPQPSVVENIPSRTKPPGRSARSRGKARAQDSDTASSHTFGTSSASLSSASGPRGNNSRATSRTSAYSSTTPQTSANDMTSDDDDDMIGRHPIPPIPRRVGASRRFATPDRNSFVVDFSEEEEFDHYTEDYEHEAENESLEQINRVSSDRGTFFGYSNPSQDTFAIAQSGRRGSSAMHIPNVSAPSDSSFHEKRSLEYSNGRRGSKSIEDFRSISYLRDSEHSSLAPNQRPATTAPTSVPESGGDWREVRKRSLHLDKELPSIGPLQASGSGMTTTPPVSQTPATDSETKANPATAEFDTSWMELYGASGLSGLDMSEMTDIIGTSIPNGRASFYALRKGSTASANRRQSTVSSLSMDIMHKYISGPWATQKYLDQRHMWIYMKEQEGNDDESRRRVGNGNERERDRPSITALFAPRPSISTGQDFTPGSSTFFDKPENREKDKPPATKSKPHKEPWNGMRIGSQEMWFNGFNGRYRVQRRNAISLEQGKPPQQRLHVSPMRNSHSERPTVTIHKHSKAAAFSIGRYHRPNSSSNGTPAHNNGVASQGGSSQDSANGSGKRSDMILLATSSVQIAYYSTSTTRKLDTHGLLDDNGRPSSKDVERSKDNDRDRQRTRTKEKERERAHLETPSASSSKGYNSTQAKAKEIVPAEMPLPDSEGSSTGSISNAISSGDSGTLVNGPTPVTTPEQSEAHHSSAGSIEHSIRSLETTSSDRTTIRTISHRVHHRKRGVYDVDDEDDEEVGDSSDEMPRYPTRTPHRETYAALPPEVFETSHQDHPSGGLLWWGRSKGGNQYRHRANVYLENAYNPPWPVTQPRSNSETRKGIVDDLNTSFQDVGLLPAIGEIKGSSSHSAQNRRRREQHAKKQHRHTSDKNRTDIFEEVPDDALYMVLPLWPSQTDSHSARRHPFDMPSIATHARQYLLIYYKTPPSLPTVPEEGGKTRSGEKKRSQETGANEGVNDRSVFLHTFHISARVFSYRDLQGSGIRIPDVGLAVTGPLKEAFESIPACIRKDDYVIGVCHHRESGVEFVPEGFEKIGLSKNIPNPRPSEPSEDDDSNSFDTMTVLTPLGRAVMEMAWMGALAVTSFNPNNHHV